MLSNDKKLLGAHCVKEAKSKEIRFDGIWKNITTACNLPNIPQYNPLFTSNLVLKGNKIKFSGQVFKFKDKKIILKIPHVELRGMINDNKIKLKITSIKPNSLDKTRDKKIKKDAKKCEIEFVKTNEVQQDLTKSISKEYCFCIDSRKKSFSNIKI